jgi:putative protease
MKIASLIEAPVWRVPAKGPLRRPEILAPAGNEEMMRAAVENGADAIYFGLQQFNARMRAANFDMDDLPRIMAWLHERGVKGYVTFNTLVFCDELPAAAEVLQGCSDAGVDALLVQDLGIARLANEMVPDLPIHASTQMTLTSAESVNAVEAMGLRLERIVAARELSRKELQTMRRGTERDIEVFVHGAICVAYSGQCLTSEALGGRSANRGECAQACRLPYDLVVDGEKQDLGDVRYLLSPRDLAAHEDIGDLMRIGIVSLKIEGRLKSPQYVAATVQSYRAAVESVLANPEINPDLDAAHRRDLEMTFSRGFTGGYLHDIDHQAVVEGRFPKKRGLYLGRVTASEWRGVTVALEGPLKPGDGIVFDDGNPDGTEQGGRVYELFTEHHRLAKFDPLDGDTPHTEVMLTFGERALDTRRVRVGDRVWKTSDPARDADLTASYEGDRIRYRRPVTATVSGAPGQPLRLALVDWDGLRVEVEDTAPAETPSRHALSRETLMEQIGRMGNTPFELADVAMEFAAPVMVPFSRLNELRRRAVEALIAQRRKIGLDRRFVPSALDALRGTNSKPTATSTEPTLALLCRSLEQVEAAVAHGGVSTIYTDFEDIRLHREARQLVPRGGPRFVPATLRIMKSGEGGIVRKLLEAEPDAVLVRNPASWQILRAVAPTLPLLGDYGLNIANDITARLHMEHGFESLVPSYDLNIDQLLDLLRCAPPSWFEVTIQQYMPMFHMEHCVFCRFLSTGTDFTNCGRPCESHDLRLRDRIGSEHPVKADAGCRNTVYNAIPQSASAYMTAILGAGVRRFRADCLLEDAAQVRAIIDGYLPAMRGEEDGRELWRRLRATSKLGVTKGSLDHL